ncbi:hypothetical protein [Rhodococcoides yunnanense]|uniref:hypothetical protein n=1 Tax=Rhodococcoides yunnanense TaxID=278209 RepID=UPI001114E4BE|nr:hypothetical protein [Rhodococcus yunnanensis]
MKNGRFEDFDLARVVTDNLVSLGIRRGDPVTILETLGDHYLVQAVNMNDYLQMPWGDAEHSDLEPSDGTDENGNSLVRPIPGPP